MNTIIEYLKRNLLLGLLLCVGMVALGLTFGKFFFEFIATIMMACIAEMVALLLSNLAVYAYTHVNFTRGISYGEDGQLDDIERQALSTVIGHIFLGVHFLVGLALIGVYIANFS